MKANLARKLEIILAAVLALIFLPAYAQLSVEWITQFGSNGADGGEAITLDALGQSWVIGYADGSFGGAINAGGQDPFLDLFSASGSMDWDGGYSMAIEVDASGNIHLTGNTFGNLDGREMDFQD
jgi:hypothetical protein